MERDVQNHGPDVRETMSAGRKLQRMVSPSERDALQTRLDAVQDRYDNIRDKTHQKKVDLNRALATSQVFGEDEAALLRWLTDMERKLGRPQPISIHPEVVQKQLDNQTVLIPTPNSHPVLFWEPTYLSHHLTTGYSGYSWCSTDFLSLCLVHWKLHISFLHLDLLKALFPSPVAHLRPGFLLLFYTHGGGSEEVCLLFMCSFAVQLSNSLHIPCLY